MMIVGHLFLILTAVLQIILLLRAAFTDVLKRTISSEVCVMLFVVSACSQLVEHGLLHLLYATSVTASLGFLMLFLINYFGGGDIKLFLALSIGLSFQWVLQLTFRMAVVGGLLCLMVWLMRSLPRPARCLSNASLLRVYAVERWRILRHAPLPYGVAIAGGGIWTVISTTTLTF